MRNYLSELENLGYSTDALSKLTGLSKERVIHIINGALPKSNTKDYETIRNTNRRVSYERARHVGLNSHYATQVRRNLTNPHIARRSNEPIEIKKRAIKAKYAQGIWQLHMLGMYQNKDTKEYREHLGFSKSHQKKEYSKALAECKAYSIRALSNGATVWEFRYIINQYWQKYDLKTA